MPPHLVGLAKPREIKKNKEEVARNNDPPASYSEAVTKINETVELLKTLKRSIRRHTDIKRTAVYKLEHIMSMLHTQNKKRTKEQMNKSREIPTETHQELRGVHRGKRTPSR